MRDERPQPAAASNSSAAFPQKTRRNPERSTDCQDGFLCGYRLPIHDRDPLLTTEFRDILSAGGVNLVRLPRRSPNLNAYAERFVRSIKHECLNRLVIFSEGMLRYIIKEYLDHYHAERNHQGIDSKIITPKFTDATATPIAPSSRLGGLLNYYGVRAA